MKKNLHILLLLLALTTPLHAQDWSLGVHGGPFVFGDFAERSLRIGTGEGPQPAESSTLTAASRAGLAVDLERSLGERWGVRAEATFTRSELAIGSTEDEQFAIDAGELDVVTFTLPIVYRINRGGTFRFHLMAGPAYAAYRVKGTPAVFTGTRAEWGAAFGGGIAWRWSERFSVEGNLTDIITESPIRETDFPTARNLEIPETHNVHTTVGLRWKF